MADGMHEIIAHGGGEILYREERNYGVIITLTKKPG